MLEGQSLLQLECCSVVRAGLWESIYQPFGSGLVAQCREYLLSYKRNLPVSSEQEDTVHSWKIRRIGFDS